MEMNTSALKRDRESKLELGLFQGRREAPGSNLRSLAGAADWGSRRLNPG
jgi:hypothetical protein